MGNCMAKISVKNGRGRGLNSRIPGRSLEFGKEVSGLIRHSSKF